MIIVIHEQYLQDQNVPKPIPHGKLHQLAKKEYITLVRVPKPNGYVHIDFGPNIFATKHQLLPWLFALMASMIEDYGKSQGVKVVIITLDMLTMSSEMLEMRPVGMLGEDITLDSKILLSLQQTEKQKIVLCGI